MKAGLGVPVPGPNDQPLIKEAKIDFKSLDRFSNRLNSDAPKTEQGG